MRPPPPLSLFLHSRGFCTSSQRYAAPSIARLLETPPENSDNVEVYGRIRSIRHHKKMAFAAVEDGSSLQTMQAILTPEQGQDISTGTGVRLVGSWRSSPNPKCQSHELHVTGLEVAAAVDPANYAIQKKYQTTDYLRTMPHLRIRTPLNSLLLRFRSKCKSRLCTFFDGAGYTHIDTPTLTSSDCEGGGETFIVTTEKTLKSEETFFKSKKYLTVSAQLHLEAAAQALQKVWTLSNTFRAEKSETARHLSEFQMLEAEITFVNDLGKVMTVIEDMLRDLVIGLHKTKEGSELIHGKRSIDTDDLDHEADELRRPDLLEARWQGMMREQWPRITYTKAITLLKSSTHNFEHEPVWGLGLKSEHEDYIATLVGKGSPVFVTCYPKSIKPFYMLSSAISHEHGETVECFDLLVPDVCEIVGGSLREHAYGPLISNMQQKGMIPQGSNLLADDFGSLHWYVNLRNQGYVPSGGFGLGFDRLIMYLSGVENIREVVTFPSWVGH